MSRGGGYAGRADRPIPRRQAKPSPPPPAPKTVTTTNYMVQAAVPAEPRDVESFVFPRYQVQYEDHEDHTRSTWAYCRDSATAVTIARLLNDTRSWRGDFIVRDIRGGVVYAP